MAGGALTVDVVIVSHNSRDRLAAAVTPLAAADGVQVVVVDNASTDGTVDLLGTLPVTALPQAENLGFAVGCNIGWRAGGAPYVLFLNPDAQLSEDDLRRLVAALDERPTAGAAAPRMLDGDGTLEFSLRRLPRLRSTFAQALFLHRVLPRAAWTDEHLRDRALYERTWTPECLSGACVLVRRSVLEQLGGWDERFFLYGEDVDLSRRIRDAGWELLYVPEASVLHVGGASEPRENLLPVLARARLQYARKYHGPAYVTLERTGIALGELTHAAVGRRERRAGHLRAFWAALGR